MSRTWHLLTGDYPPDCGGVGDYAESLAEALAQGGDEVHIWTPAGAARQPRARVALHTLPDAFGRASRDAMQRAWAVTPGIVLLQYVPNALGAKGANLPFCRWFSRLRSRVDDVRVMFHEPFFYFTWTRPWAVTNALALVQRRMARALLAGAAHVYYSTETWCRYLPRDGAETLPIPSSLPVAEGAGIARQRETASGGHPDAPLVGHFGTYGAHVAGELSATLPALFAAVPGLRLALLGAGGPAFLSSLLARHPEFRDRAWAPGRLDPGPLACALRACDVLAQPYPDGVTTRRTSLMAGLKNGVATISTDGALTEPVWSETGAVALAPAGATAAFAAATAALVRDAAAREALGRRGAAVYSERFSMEHTIAVLRSGRPS